jgi:hypothetical protein
MSKLPARIRVARFFLVRDTKTGKNTKLTQNIPNGHKIHEMSVKYSKCKKIHIFQSKALKNLPKLGFLV